MADKEEKRTIFRRIRGRIVPITVSVTGAAIAADAARSDVVRVSKSGAYSVRKKYALMPMSLSKGNLVRGTQITSFTKFGKKRGSINFITNSAGEGEIDWLGVKRNFRGKGISKELAHDAAVELQRSGVKTISSHVVHQRSAGLFGDKVKSRYWKSYYFNKAGEAFVTPISKTEALKKVAAYKWKSKKSHAAVFRDVKIPRLRRITKPFKSVAIKSKLALGIGLVGLGAYLASRRDKK